MHVKAPSPGEPAPIPDVTDDVGAKIRSGVAWKAASQVTLQVSRMVVALVLARLLAPGQWGLAAMVLVFSGFVVVFTDNALGTALIQRRKLHAGDRSTVFWISAGIGLALALGGIALAGPLSSFYGQAEVRPLFMAISVGFLVSALGTTHGALLARDMRFRRLELRQIAATVVGSIAGITIAVKGFGAWAIVGQQLAEAATSTVLLWCLLPWRPSLRVSTASLRRMGGFAGNVFGENLLYQAGRNLGVVLMGRFFTSAAVGAYALATNVILVPFARLGGPLQQVFFPAFSRMDGDRQRIADVWIRASRLVGAFAMPALVGLVIVAPEFVDVVLGKKWSEATPLIRILAWVGLVQALQTLNGEVLLALNKSGTLLRFTAVWFVGVVGAYALGIQWGVIGVAACYAVATALLEPLRAYLTTHALGIPLRRFVFAFSGVVQASALMALVLIGLRQVLVSAGLSPAELLVALVPVGALAYAAACVWRAPEVTGEVARVLRRRPSKTTSHVEPLAPRLSED